MFEKAFFLFAFEKCLLNCLHILVVGVVVVVVVAAVTRFKNCAQHNLSPSLKGRIQSGFMRLHLDK